MAHSWRNSVTLRSLFQLGFLLLNVWIGIQFYLWVRYYESGGQTVSVSRPPGVEGWLPIASLMNLKAWVVSGSLPEIHPAGVFLLLAFLSISLLFRKAFCGWLCPVGTLSETLWTAGRRLFGRNLLVPRLFDIPLRVLKYLLLGLFLLAVGSMSVPEIRLFLDGPYGIIADVKMLNFFRQISLFSAVVVILLVLLAVVVKNFWCRYLCPYGALLGLLSWFSPMRVKRDPEFCTECGKCARVCPARLPVDRLTNVHSPECLGCYECVESCPTPNALEMKAGNRRISPAWAAAGIAAVFLGLVFLAMASGNWHTSLPDEVYHELIPRADQFSHP